MSRVEHPPSLVRPYGASPVHVVYRGRVGSSNGIDAWLCRLVAPMPGYAYSIVAYDSVAGAGAGADAGAGASAGAFAGMVSLYHAHFGAEQGDIPSDGPCAHALDRLAARHGVADDRAIVLGSSSVAPNYRGQGVGVLLYLASAAVARKEHNAAVVADACTVGGTTSDMARRVWKSLRFSKHVDVSGLVGVFIGSSKR